MEGLERLEEGSNPVIIFISYKVVSNRKILLDIDNRGMEKAKLVYSKAEVNMKLRFLAPSAGISEEAIC